jgi:RecA/RadA recombinase
MSKKNFDLNKYKKAIKQSSTPLKKDKFIVLDQCMHSVLGMPGIPMGHITQVYGKSDTGKTSLMFHAAARAQAQGILPVIIVTEGKVDWERARGMGFQYYGDLSEEEKVERGIDPGDDGFAIVEEELEYLEDVFQFVDKICADVEMGDLPQDVMVFWDSVGNTLSQEEVEVQKDGTTEKKKTMMKAAKVITENMRVISKKINNTRKISHPKFVGLFIVNQAYTKPPAFAGGMSTIVPYGGDAIWFRSSLVLKTQRKSKLRATKDKVKMGFGILSKITVDKNHLTNTAHEGEFVITADEILPNETGAIKDYKDTHKDQWGNAVIFEEDE